MYKINKINLLEQKKIPGVKKMIKRELKENA
jgi:hypothetical protein